MIDRCRMTSFLLLLLLNGLSLSTSSAFLCHQPQHKELHLSPFSSTRTTKFLLQSTTLKDDEEVLHPAVEGWPQKYAQAGGDDSSSRFGPRVLSQDFDVHQASEYELYELDVKNWPTWSTDDKPKWAVGNQVVDKEMPYGELSYMISGRLEIIPKSTGVPVIVEVGDFVTFPKGFVASWKVLEELTWYYYLY